VLGLARSDGAADALARSGVEAHRGDLSDPESLAAGARACEGVIHLAFIADFSTMMDNLEKDRRAIGTLAGAIGGCAPALVVPSVTLALTPGRLAREEDALNPNAFGAIRIPSEQAALAATSGGVRVSVVRLPPSVHGDGDHGLVGGLIYTAREKGVSAYVADGKNRWPAVHRLDAACLFRLALEKGSAGARYHAVAEEGAPFREIAEVIGRRLKLPVVSKSPEEANGDPPGTGRENRRPLGLLAGALGLDRSDEDAHRALARGYLFAARAEDLPQHGSSVSIILSRSSFSTSPRNAKACIRPIWTSRPPILTAGPSSCCTPRIFAPPRREATIKALSEAGYRAIAPDQIGSLNSKNSAMPRRSRTRRRFTRRCLKALQDLLSSK